MAELPAEAADRLVKILGMLGSQHDGERAAAARKADEIVRTELGMTWTDVLGAAGGERRKWKEPRDTPEAVAMALAFSECLTEWEHEFLKDVFGKRRFSPKQKDVICRIVDKTRKYANAWGSVE